MKILFHYVDEILPFIYIIVEYFLLKQDKYSILKKIDLLEIKLHLGNRYI